MADSRHGIGKIQNENGASCGAKNQTKNCSIIKQCNYVIGTHTSTERNSKLLRVLNKNLKYELHNHDSMLLLK